MNKRAFIGLDVGEKRIGVAVADGAVRIAVPRQAVLVDGTEVEQIKRLVEQERADTIVVGYPRNQQGEATAQTRYVEAFTQSLEALAPTLVFQDESLTSVIAEDQLKSLGKPYTKGDIDSQAAALILRDYLETHRG